MVNFVLSAVTSFGGSYTMSGGQGDCISIGSATSDVVLGMTLVLAGVLFGRKGPSAFWTGVVTTEFVRYVPSAALMAWVIAFTPIQIGTLHHSAIFWWTSRALIATTVAIWLCVKRDGPAPRDMVVSVLASVTLLVFLSLRWDDFPANPILPWRADLLLNLALRGLPH
ncbi:hypothetical protein [Myxococcus vastator]|uniref:hypothetical protein n=1 Tax=Myxococcus vastator TaxID=2709664 RepID=UPI0013D1C708|nr:hypothetical protein [Myxococcus vastator]